MGTYLWTGVRYHGGQGERSESKPRKHFFEIIDKNGRVLVTSREFENAFQTKEGFRQLAERVMDLMVPDPLAPPEIEGTQP